MEKYYITQQDDNFYGQVFILMREIKPNLFDENPTGVIGKYLSMAEAERIKAIMESEQEFKNLWQK